MSSLPFSLAFLTICVHSPHPIQILYQAKELRIPLPDSPYPAPQTAWSQEGDAWEEVRGKRKKRKMERGVIKRPVLSSLLRWSVLLKAISHTHPPAAHASLSSSPKGCRAPSVPSTAGSLCRLWALRTLKCLQGPLCHPNTGSTGGLPIARL